MVGAETLAGISPIAAPPLATAASLLALLLLGTAGALALTARRPR